MNIPRVVTLGVLSLSCVGATVVAGMLGTGPATPGNSPDVLVSDISGISHYGAVDGVSAYAIGTTACNIGPTPLAWFDQGDQAWRHPVIAQNLYRYENGRFEQIGMSWLKHGFCAADSTLCGSCTPFADCDWLAPGCSDTYVSALNGFQTYLGPRSEVNPVTGLAAWPHSLPANHPTLAGRLLVQTDDLSPSLHPAARYFAEGHYIHPDDAFFNNDNNVTHDEVMVGDLFNDQFLLSFAGEVNAGSPAIEAWPALEPGVQLEYISVVQDGLFIVGHHATPNEDGTWHYEYALYNMYSERAARGLTISIPAGVTLTNIGFHDADYHSNEPYDDTDWSLELSPNAITWTCPPFETSPNANALRWGTLYNVRFDADGPPTATDATLLLFKPGVIPDIQLTLTGPAAPAVVGDLDMDGVVGISDLLVVLATWGPCDAPCTADLDGDGHVTMVDLKVVLANWSA